MLTKLMATLKGIKTLVGFVKLIYQTFNYANPGCENL